MILTTVLSCHGLCKGAPVVLTGGSVLSVSELVLSWKQILLVLCLSLDFLGNRSSD